MRRTVVSILALGLVIGALPAVVLALRGGGGRGGFGGGGRAMGGGGRVSGGGYRGGYGGVPSAPARSRSAPMPIRPGGARPGYGRPGGGTRPPAATPLPPGNLPIRPPGGGQFPPGRPTHPIQLPPGTGRPPDIGTGPGGGGWHNGSWRWYWWGGGPYYRRWLRGSWIYPAGYDVYDNPYGDEVPMEPEPTTQDVWDVASQLLSQAQSEFGSRDYSKANLLIDKALRLKPGDRTLLEFRALVYFARRLYKKAAEDLHVVLSTGPGWDWSTLIGFYGRKESYTTHLRGLEDSVEKDPRNSAARLVLAYQYMVGSHLDKAKEELTELEKLTPKDPLARDLLQAVDRKPGAEEGKDEIPEGPPIPADFNYRGTWAAESPQGGRVELTLKPDAEFTWSYGGGKHAATFGGEYALMKGVLLLEDKNQGPLFGTVKVEDPDAFVFRVTDAPEKDPGLKFVRE